MTKKLRILSLGAGVQSSTLALMIEKGQVPMVDAAVFSDTFGEPKAVYEWLEWLKKKIIFSCLYGFKRKFKTRYA